jgi:hypothetical protein
VNETTARLCPGSHTIDHPAPGLRNDEYLCRGCVRHAERVLGDLPSLTRDVEVTVTKQDRSTKGRKSSGKEQPLPANLSASDRARRSLELLFEWADHVAAWNGSTGLPAFTANRPLQELVPQAVGILLHHGDWMRSNEQGPDLANAVRCVRRDLRAIVDRRPDRLYAGPCEADLDYPPEFGYRCGLPLYREWGTDDITCDGHTVNLLPGQWSPTGCGHTHPVAERREWLRAEVDGRLLPLRLVWESLYVLIPGCQVEWDTAKQWTREREQRIPIRDKHGQQRYDRRGKPMVRIHTSPPRLEPQGWAIDDSPLYRGSDILMLAEDKRVRRGRRRVDRAKVA